MNDSCLDLIDDWLPRMRGAHYQPALLAVHCNVSLRELERYFAARTGQPPQRWLNRQRLLASVPLLLEGLQVKEVSFELGFSSPPRFCELFRTEFGASPRRWTYNRKAMSLLQLRLQSEVGRRSSASADPLDRARQTAQTGTLLALEKRLASP